MPTLVVDFRDARTRAHLARMLNSPLEVLGALLDGPPQTLMKTHTIPKRNRRRGWRVVHEIVGSANADLYKTLLLRFHDFAMDALGDRYPGAAAHGYVPTRSIVTNAEKHLDAKLVLNADIRDFFRTITTDRLIAVLRSQLGIWPDVARDIANLVSVDGRLALGLAPSPMCANLVCIDLDQRLLELARRTASTVTRYADDLTFSGDEVPTQHQVASILELEGFAIAEGKFRIKKRGQATFVTGLSVADSKRPRVPKAFKQRLRQELYFCNKFGVENHISRTEYSSFTSGVNRIEGSIRYLRGVERALGRKLQAEWDAVLQRDGISAAYAPRMERLGEPVTVFVDEATIKQDGADLLVLLCVVVENVAAVRNRLVGLRDDLLADPFTTARKSDLRKKGLHFADLSPEARQRAYDVVALIPCRSYVAFDACGSYEETYRQLLHDLLRQRFVALDRRPVEIVCERNPAVPSSLPGQVVASIFGDLAAKESRRPLQQPSVSVVGKEEPGLWLADGLLWAFQSFATNFDGTSLTRFESLRRAYRVIRDLRPPTRTYARRRKFELGALAIAQKDPEAKAE